MLTSQDKKTVTIFTLKQQNIYTFKAFLRRKQTCTVGTQKICVKEMVLLRTQNHCQPCQIRKQSQYLHSNSRISIPLRLSSGVNKHVLCVLKTTVSRRWSFFLNPKPLLTSRDKKTVTILALKQQNIYTFKSFLRRKQTCDVCLTETVLLSTKTHVNLA